MARSFKVFLILTSWLVASDLSLGIDNFLTKATISKYQKKNIGVITNHTAISSKGEFTIDRLLKTPLKIKALFAPEHGFFGNFAAAVAFKDDLYEGKIPIYSLHGKTRRPTKEMLKGLDVLVFDIQDIGIRPYTYTSTLFYCMEEAKKYGIEVVVLDRPNPMGGHLFDGPLLEESLRSFIGYINIPYRHGMTVCELAAFFNSEYKIGCHLTTYPMRGWKRSMTFKDLDLLWVPTSPNIPEPDTPFYCATTGFIGELSIINIGIGSSYPFKIAVAPWIDAKKFTSALQRQKLPGVIFTPYYHTPKIGSLKDKLCQGVRINITDTNTYQPIATGNMILGLLKSLYPHQVKKSIAGLKKMNIDLFNKACGSEQFLAILQKETFPAYKLIAESRKDHPAFEEKRVRYLLYN